MTIEENIKLSKISKEKTQTENRNHMNIKIKESTTTKGRRHATVKIVNIGITKERKKIVIDNKKETDNLLKKMTIIGIKEVNKLEGIPKTEEIIMIDEIKNNIKIIHTSQVMIGIVIKVHLDIRKSKAEIIKILIDQDKIRKMNKIKRFKFSID